MNKIYSLLLLVLMSYSCSNDDVVSKDNPQQRKPGRVINALDPTKLARVIFYPGTNNERRWFFYPNGLLKKIVDANGTLLQTFVYDTNNNWIKFQLFGANPIFSIFNYDGNNRVSNSNTNGTNFTYNFNPATNSYVVGAYTRTLNSDNTYGSEWYLDYYEEEDANGNITYVPYNVYGYFCGYNNNNQTISGNYDNPSRAYYQHDNKVNPFKTALLPICKIAPLTKTFGISNYWLNANFNSQNNVTLESYEIEDPESFQFEYVYNSNNLPISQTRKSYYFNTLETTTLDILYYYQGDPIP